MARHTAPPHVLIVGTGSAGQRHARNLVSLGATVSCFDLRPERLTQVQAELRSVASVYDSLEHAVSDADRFAGVVIASPPVFHVDQALMFLERGIPVLLEKPVAPDLRSAVKLEEALKVYPAPLLLGYTYRWWLPFIELRRRLMEQVLGPLRHARFIMSAHLADWHPWERYQDFFMARRELGGGALLDESHFIDLMLWLFGMPASLWGRAECLSQLEITSDDNVDVLALYPENFRVSIHLDLYGRPHERSVTVVGEDGTLQCLFDPHVLRFSRDAGGNWQATGFNCERNDMFVSEAREFLDLAMEQVNCVPTCTIQDGVQVLRCVEAVRLSCQQEKMIRLDTV